MRLPAGPIQKVNIGVYGEFYKKQKIRGQHVIISAIISSLFIHIVLST
jgi:hypothetical protein